MIGVSVIVMMGLRKMRNGRFVKDEFAELAKDR